MLGRNSASSDFSIRLLADKLQDVAKHARHVRIEHDNFLQLAEYMEQLVPVARQLQENGNRYEDVVEVLEKDVDSAHELVNLCTSKGQMYLLTHCRSVVRQLENVTHDMGRNLQLLAQDEQLRSLVSDLSQSMQQVQFQVQASEERICRALERETSTIRGDLAVQTGILVDIARTVGVEDFTKNPYALKSQIDMLKNDIQGPDDLHMMHLIGTMFENFVKKQGRTSQDRQPGRRRLEEPYDSFLCPLTREVMADPVTIVETGKTYERSAIENWFNECQKKGEWPSCPLTKKVVNSLELKPSIALRNTIEEWHARNEAARIENAVPLLNSSSDEDMLDALEDVQALCRQNKYNKSKVKNIGLIAIIVERLKNSEEVRCKALETLRLLAEDDDDIKEAIGETTAIWSAVKCLSRELSRERDEAVMLLLELSKYIPLCQKIGASNGAILILVGMTSSMSENTPSAGKADETLRYLERCDDNVRQMAENGRLQPLITRLTEGSEELRVQMANLIADIPMNNDGKTYLADSGSPILIHMLDSPKPAVREAALKSLRVLSTLDSNGKTLIQAGVLPPLLRDLFMSGIGQAPVKLKEVAATVLANVINSSSDWESVDVDAEGTLCSEKNVHNLLLLISNTGPAIEAKLLQVLLGLTSSPHGAQEVVTHIRSFGAIISLIQFLEAPQKELLVTAVKLLCALSSYMGQELADGLRITTRQLGTLVRILGHNGVNEEIAASAGLLANLPMEDFNLTRALLDEGIVPILIGRINDLSRGVVRIGAGKFVAAFHEGLIAILARFTYDVDDPDLLILAREQEFCSLFTSMVQTVRLNNAQKWSARALENLSMKSKILSEIPEVAPPEGCMCCLRPPLPPVGLCTVHAGKCSAKETFCLIEAKAVEPLVACLEHRDVSVVEAVLQALSTLIQEPCDVERGVQVLSDAGAVLPILTILQEPKTEGLRERSVWMVERILRNADLAQSIVGNADVHTSLVDAFRHGNYRSRQLAERSLKHLNKIPNFSGVFPAAGRR